MSAKATFWAWEQELKHASKIVLLALANFSNEKHESWYSYESLANACGLSRRSVITHCKRLVELGLLTIKERRKDDKTQFSNLFRLKVFVTARVIRDPELEGEGDAPPSKRWGERDSLGSERDSLGSESPAPKSKNEFKNESKTHTHKGECQDSAHASKPLAQSVCDYKNILEKLEALWQMAGSAPGSESESLNAITRYSIESLRYYYKNAKAQAERMVEIRQSNPTRHLPTIANWFEKGRHEASNVDKIYPKPQAPNKCTAVRQAPQHAAHELYKPNTSNQRDPADTEQRYKMLAKAGRLTVPYKAIMSEWLMLSSGERENAITALGTGFKLSDDVQAIKDFLKNRSWL